MIIEKSNAMKWLRSTIYLIRFHRAFRLMQDRRQIIRHHKAVAHMQRSLNRYFALSAQRESLFELKRVLPSGLGEQILRNQ